MLSEITTGEMKSMRIKGDLARANACKTSNGSEARQRLGHQDSVRGDNAGGECSWTPTLVARSLGLCGFRAWGCTWATKTVYAKMTLASTPAHVTSARDVMLRLHSRSGSFGGYGLPRESSGKPVYPPRGMARREYSTSGPCVGRGVQCWVDVLYGTQCSVEASNSLDSLQSRIYRIL